MGSQVFVDFALMEIASVGCCLSSTIEQLLGVSLRRIAELLGKCAKPSDDDSDDDEAAQFDVFRRGHCCRGMRRLGLRLQRRHRREWAY